MGKDNLNEQQLSESIQTKPELVDFLYIDSERVDSFISQLKNGTLRSVSKTNATLQGSSDSAKFGFDAKIVSGGIGNTEKINNTTSATENYDPYHKQIIDLINMLPCDPIDISLPNIAKLGFLTGEVIIRDMSIFTSIVPVVVNNPKVFGPTAKEAKANLKAMSELIKATPGTIDITITTDDGYKISGTVAENYLKIPLPSILKNYGTSMPGKWVIIGIFDTYSEPLISTEAPIDDNTTVESMVDTYAETIKAFYARSAIKVIPLIIFRVVNL